MLSGLDDIVAGHGYTTMVVSGRRRAASEEAALHQVLELHVDGIVCATAALGRAALLDAARSTAVVNLTRTPQVPRVDSVVNDDHTGATLAVEHLAGLGHRRIAMIADTAERAGADRIRGYRDAMGRLGLGGERQVIPGGFSERGGYAAGRRLLSVAAGRVSAICVASDLAALGVLDAAVDAGVHVPGELSVIGYDNTPFAALRHIALSSIDQAASDIGVAAAHALLDRIERPRRPARRLVIAPTLVARGTTGPAPE
jgi:DNA-binding LacI/PurR family transcriptional regulator